MSVSQPVIGIVPSFDDGKLFAPASTIERQYIRRDYTYMVAQVGAVPMILSPDMPIRVVLELCDGIVISGGADIAPRVYGQKRLKTVKRIEPTKRFQWETKLIKACDTVKLPILGICYGMQRLNVHYGGTLLQDIPTMVPNNVGHDNTMHEVTFHKDFLGMRRLGIHTINSRHHQAVDRLAEGFDICATAPDGIIEAIRGHGHYGMQWHPESDETGAHVYRAFVEYCINKTEGESI